MKRNDNKRGLITILSISTAFALLVMALVRYERDAPGTKIHSWVDGVWYLFETLTTVGYGDILPVTPSGRVIGFIFLLSSFGVYGFIIGQIANFMSTLREQRELGLLGSKFTNHVVMIGWNDFGQSVVTHLVGAGRQVAVITKDRSHIDIIREYYDTNQVYTLYSDYNNYDMLEKANIQEASIVFVNLNDDTEKLVYIINIKKHFANLNYVVTLDNGNLKSTFQNAGVTYAISKNEISSKLLASYIFEPDVALFSEEILAYAHEDHAYDLKQFRMLAGNPLVNTPYDKAFFDLKKQCNVILTGIVKTGNGQRTFLKNPEGDVRIEANDYLVMMMDRKGEERLRRVFKMEEGV
jgi:voltage-gated potassium channel